MINDDNIYNYVKTFTGRVTLYQYNSNTGSGELTTEGKKFINSFPTEKIYGTIFQSGELDSKTQNIFLSLFPNIKAKKITPSTTYTEDIEVLDSQRKITTKYRYTNTVENIKASSVGSFDGINLLNSLIGNYGTYTQTGTVQNTVNFYITIFTNDFKNALYLYISERQYTVTATATIVPLDYIPRYAGFYSGLQPIKISSDPYTNGGNTSEGGGGGTFGGGNTIFGGTSDSIDIPPLPSASASNAGFITLFNPSLSQLNNLANYMWSDLFSLDTFKKIFADPMDCILGLSIVPVKPASAGTSAVKIGNVSTDVSMNKTSSQYVAVDCGTIDVKEYWGAYLDYAPYTQCEIYLPYVGTKQISVDDVMNKAVHVVYHVDILSGACNAYVKCGNSVLYTFVGQCSSSIPISGNDWTNVLNGAISVAGKIGLAMATGGATALMSGLGAASSIISSSKPTVERSGAMSSTGGLLGIQKPYLILTRPKQALPENQNKYTGYPSFITMALSDCTGYTEIDSVHLENMSCTDEEAQEIENLLKSGVIF